MLLSTDALTRRFGGITAVNAVDYTLESGELCSVIGPNGAGKTTFFNLLTGVLEPSSGSIQFHPSTSAEPVDVTDADPHETALLGIHRSYQITNIFPAMSVRENVRIAVQAHRGNDSWCFWRNVGSFDDHLAEADRILHRVGLLDQASRPAQTLSHGEKRGLEIAIALAGEPDLLLLDEPTAGVSSEDVETVTDLIEDVATDHTIMLIEHNMDVVMDISDRIVVLHRGELIADGDPEAIRESETVQQAYLGGYDGTGATGGGATNGDGDGENGDNGVSEGVA